MNEENTKDYYAEGGEYEQAVAQGNTTEALTEYLVSLPKDKTDYVTDFMEKKLAEGQKKIDVTEVKDYAETFEDAEAQKDWNNPKSVARRVDNAQSVQEMADILEAHGLYKDPSKRFQEKPKPKAGRYTTQDRSREILRTSTVRKPQIKSQGLIRNPSIPVPPKDITEGLPQSWKKTGRNSG